MYVGIGKYNGKVISKEDAYDFAIEEIANNEELKKELVEWFFSGDWIEKEDTDENISKYVK